MGYWVAHRFPRFFMSDPGTHDPDIHTADLANRIQQPQQGGAGAGRGQQRRALVPRAAPQPGFGGMYSNGPGGHPQGTGSRPSRGNAGGVLGKVWRVVSSAMGSPSKFQTELSIPGQDSSDPPDALGRWLGDSAEMMGLVGTEQGGGEVSGLDQGREATGSDPTERAVNQPLRRTAQLSLAMC